MTERDLAIVDLFAGPGGWDLGAHLVGLPDPLGIEWDDAAVLTRRAADLWTEQADVGALNPGDTLNRHGIDELDGLIASPPCQAWSMAGKGLGRTLDVQHVERAADRLAGRDPDWRRDARLCADKRSMLAVEPLRWTLALRPTWNVWENVPPVLAFWNRCAGHLRRAGYAVWTGIVMAEQHGVPQTRRRAVLIARRDDGLPQAPTPTHRRYLPPPREPQGVPSLFDAGERQPLVYRGEEHLLPWVSMAQALGWEDGPAPRPAPTVTGGGSRWGDPEVFASVHARRVAAEAVALRTGNFTATARDADGGRSAEGSEPYERPATEPAPTVRAAGAGSWVPTHLDVRQEGAVPRSIDQPAATVTSAGLAKGRDVWTRERPATTVACDARIFRPGHHGMKSQSVDAIRVEPHEAATLQSFPPDHPWQGSRSKVFEQIGNAVPPLMAAAILREATR